MENKQFSLIEIFTSLKRGIPLLFLMTFLGITVAATLTFLCFKPQYEATTQLLINRAQTSEQTNAYQETQTDLQLMNTYTAIAKSDVILEAVIDNLELPMDAKDLKKSLVISSEENSKVMNITVRNEDPVVVTKITNTLADVFIQKIPSLLAVENVQILSKSELQKNLDPVSPNIPLNFIIGAILGLIFGIFIIFIRQFIDQRFKTEKEVEDFLQLPVLGTIHKMKQK